MAKKSNLMAALGKPSVEPVALPETEAAPAPTAARSQKAGAAKSGKESRADLVAVTSYLDPQFRQNLLMLKAMRAPERVTMESLHAEGLNLLFEKYNLPTVRK